MLALLPLLPLTALLVGAQFVGPALPLPAINLADYEPVIFCDSLGISKSPNLHKMPVSDLSLGNIMNWLDPTIGISCDTSSGLIAPDPSLIDPTLAVHIPRRA